MTTKKILEKEIHKEYKKMTLNELKNVAKAQEKVVKNLELEDRVFETTQRQCFATVKDHKENFPNKVTARLINPMKPESGKISKQDLGLKCQTPLRLNPVPHDVSE